MRRSFHFTRHTFHALFRTVMVTAAFVEIRDSWFRCCCARPRHRQLLSMGLLGALRCLFLAYLIFPASCVLRVYNFSVVTRACVVPACAVCSVLIGMLPATTCAASSVDSENATSDCVTSIIPLNFMITISSRLRSPLPLLTKPPCVGSPHSSHCCDAGLHRREFGCSIHGVKR